MDAGRLFEPAGAALLRAAAVSPGGGVPRWPDLADTDDCRGWLGEVWPAASEAVGLASGALAARVGQILGGVPVTDRRVRGAATTVIRYLLRSGGRATPFALFAGVAPARFGTGRVEAILRHLVAEGFLLSGLRAPMTVPDPLGHLVTALRRAGAADLAEAAPLLADLEQIETGIGECNALPTVQAQSEPRAVLVAAMDRIGPQRRSPLASICCWTATCGFPPRSPPA
ncbi:hypothetical protein BL253_00910 [Pseudofrankia asymbiotica]|uniref:Lantibiotic dehydratase N-terminal domain-containing protein n=1 Tax=Pseudofrankia asymbiotica TaxID=1834516 RepID=A0A1V2IK68_9ACTN|nr:lantibiotic dehydratase [Pseudofrankia asymbiotica]ONH33612.1 hypothetical protein BL253_00910 [Pseudofrankia asymbiotica]